MRPRCGAPWPVPDSGAESVRCTLLCGHTGNHESQGPDGTFAWARGEEPESPSAELVELIEAAHKMTADIRKLTTVTGPLSTSALAHGLAAMGWRRG